MSTVKIYDQPEVELTILENGTPITLVIGGGSLLWGQINGNLSDQTDLQNALNAKVPYSGATGNVTLGEYGITAGYVQLDTTPTTYTPAVGNIGYNDTTGTLETTLKGGNVQLKIGRDMFERVVNKTGVQLTKASYQAVRISDAQGQRLAVALAQANNDNNSADTLGLAVETIDNNQEGNIFTLGEVSGINTTGSLQGETWIDGDVLYLSPTTAGRITNVKPVAPQHLVVIGYVVYAHQNNGKIYVKIMNGWELGELHDVNTTGATAGQVLKYNGTIWAPSADAGVTGSGIAYQVAYWNSPSTITSNFALSFNDSVGRLGINTFTPNYRVNAVGTASTNNGIVASETLGREIGIFSSRSTTGQAALSVISNHALTFETVGTERARLTTTGNLLLGTTTDLASSILTMDSTTKGFLRPRMTTVQRDAIVSPATGLSVYNTTTNKVNYYNGTAWTEIQDTITNPVTGTGTSGQVAYWNGTTTQTGSNNLFWDAANNRLGIATNTPTSTLHSNGSVYILGTNASNTLTIRPNASVSSAFNTFEVQTTAGAVQFAINRNAAVSSLGDITINSQNIYGTDAITLKQSSGGVTLGTIGITNQETSNSTNGYTSSVSRKFTFSHGIYSLGNTILGTATADSGQRLQVTGDTLLKGSGNTSGTTALTVQNSSSANALTIKNNRTTNITSDAGQIILSSTADASNGVIEFDLNSSATQTVFATLSRGTVGTATTSINQTAVRINGGFAPTSGTATWNSLHINGTINQTGGASGITRGIYLQPILTSASDWRSIEWNNSSGWGLYGAGTANNYLAGKLGIGTTSLTSTNFSISRSITGATSASSADIVSTIQSDVTNIGIGLNISTSVQNTTFTINSVRHILVQQGSFGASATVTSQSGFHVNSSLTGATNNYGFYGDIASGTGRWNLYMNGTALNYLNGNLLIGTTTDAGQKLQVTGDTLLKGSGNTSATTALTVQNSDGTNLFRVRNDNTILIASGINFGAANNSIVPVDPTTGTSNITSVGTGVRIGDTVGTTTTGYQLFITSPTITDRQYTSGEGGIIHLGGAISFARTFSPTSGTGIFNAFKLSYTINQTGGANGITRGLYLNPTLTSAADWRSIEWTNNTGWGLYGAGTANNYLAGRLVLGSTAFGSANLSVRNNITGGTNWSQISSSGSIQSDVTSTGNSFQAGPSVADSVTISNVNNYTAEGVSLGVGSVVTNYSGFRANNNTTATNNYGFYGNIASGTGRWNLYMNGTADNYLNGSLIIGPTTASNRVVISRILSASNETSISSDRAINPTVSTAVGFRSRLYTAGSTPFTLSELSHFKAEVAVIYGTDTITNNYGFHVTSDLTTATNNFGFYGNIPSGTNRWNLYMNGTALNYLNGSLLLGTTTDAGFKLDVNGTARITPPANSVGLTLSGYSLTGTNAQSAVDISGTWNTTGTPSAVKINVTDTASNSNSRLLDIQLNGTTTFLVRKDGAVAFGGNTLNVRSVSGTFRLSTGASTTNDYEFATSVGNKTYTSGTASVITTDISFAPTSGTGVFQGYQYNGTINQTGGANGITRGLFVNPTLTAAADWRSIETSNNTGYALYLGGSADAFFNDATDFQFGTTTGTKIGTATSQKLGFWNATPIVQPTTGIAEATFVENSGGTAVNVDSTFAGYTLQQIAQALKNIGILA